MLDAVMAVYGQPVQYLSPDGMVSLPGLTGVLLRAGVPLSSDAEDTGGIAQFRDVLRLRAADFPEWVEPEQGGFVVVAGGRSIVTDVLNDPRGWYDLPLADAPE
ncbi:hypothetical protein [Roseomonas chloroacetimidivorans]|uniref:hypothetical protein n=1 Tax=Roseomonas chloroacetimidivorans TaxID=1766656 RepID=UPI003C74EDBA